MKNDDYKNAADCIEKAIVELEDAISWLDENHEDRDSLHDLVDKMTTSFLSKYRQAHINQTKSERGGEK